MYTIEQAEERFRENLRNLIGEWATEENFYENLILQGIQVSSRRIKKPREKSGAFVCGLMFE